MHSILSRYIIRSILPNILMIFLILVSISGIIRLIDELRKIEKVSYSIVEMVLYVILSIPKDFDLFLPIATLIGGLLGLSVLEESNELIVMEVFGYSKLRIALLVIKVSIPIFLCSTLINEWILPNSEQKACLHYSQLSQNNINQQSRNIKDLWVIDKNNFVCIEHVLTYDELLGVTLYCFQDTRKINKIFYIERAVFIKNIWYCFNVNELDFSDAECVINKKLLCFEWHGSVTPYLLSMITVSPNILAISKLYYCIQYFNSVGQNSKYYQLIFWNKILSIFSGVVMMIMAVSCTFGPLYRQSVSMRILCGSVMGFIFYILNQVFGVLSITYDILPMVGSALPSVVFLGISIIIIWKYLY